MRIKGHKLGAVEALLAIAVGSLGIAVIVNVVSDLTGVSHSKAVREAQDWAELMGYTVKGTTCSARDTDGDGYVSCSVLVTNESGRSDVVPLECAAAATFNDGCRYPKTTRLVVRKQ